MRVLLGPAVTFGDSSSSTLFIEPLRPPASNLFSLETYYSISYLNTLHPNIKNCSFKSFSFFYVKVSLNDGIDH